MRELVDVRQVRIGPLEGAIELSGEDGRVDEHEELEDAEDAEGHDVLGATGVERDAEFEEDGKNKEGNVYRQVSR